MYSWVSSGILIIPGPKLTDGFPQWLHVNIKRRRRKWAEHWSTPQNGAYGLTALLPPTPTGIGLGGRRKETHCRTILWLKWKDNVFLGHHLWKWQMGPVPCSNNPSPDLNHSLPRTKPLDFFLIKIEINTPYLNKGRINWFNTARSNCLRQTH